MSKPLKLNFDIAGGNAGTILGSSPFRCLVHQSSHMKLSCTVYNYLTIVGYLDSNVTVISVSSSYMIHTATTYYYLSYAGRSDRIVKECEQCRGTGRFKLFPNLKVSISVSNLSQVSNEALCTSYRQDNKLIYE